MASLDTAKFMFQPMRIFQDQGEYFLLGQTEDMVCMQGLCLVPRSQGDMLLDHLTKSWYPTTKFIIPN
jgi:hypothetical protein